MRENTCRAPKLFIDVNMRLSCSRHEYLLYIHVMNIHNRREDHVPRLLDLTWERKSRGFGVHDFICSKIWSFLSGKKKEFSGQNGFEKKGRLFLCLSVTAPQLDLLAIFVVHSFAKKYFRGKI